MAPTTTQKGNMSIFEYIAKMKSFADEMASAGKYLEEEELVSYILAGHDFDYDILAGHGFSRKFTDGTSYGWLTTTDESREPRDLVATLEDKIGRWQWMMKFKTWIGTRLGILST
jgi:hypothetical protein